MEITAALFALQDAAYADFQRKLTPTVDPARFIGVRVPALRKLAKELLREGGYEDFLDVLPHSYYDENMLHGLLLSELRDYEACVAAVDRFLPYVDNWAVCDILSPKVFRRHKAELLGKIREWSASAHPYTTRFGMEMLMSHFLDGDFEPELLEIPAGVQSEEYYVRMMQAWFFATALTKQWDASLCYVQERRLSPWVHQKTIQKACESYRIPEERKAYLKSLK